MPSRQAELLRQQVLRSQRIATIKRNIEILSNNIKRLGGGDSPEELLPARAQAIVVQEGKITALQAELRELELKQKIQKASMERSKKVESKENDEAEKTTGNDNETNTKGSKLDRVKGRDTSEEQYETGPRAELAHKKKMAELEAEVRVLSDMIDRITAEMLESEEREKDSEQASPAQRVPATETPMKTEKAESHANDTAAKKRVLERLQLTLDSPQALAAGTAENVDLTTTMHEHEPKEEVKRMAEERIKEPEKTTAGKVSGTEALPKVEDAAPYPCDSAPKKKTPEHLQPGPSSAEAMSARARKKTELLTKIHEHELKGEITRTAEQRTKAVENVKGIPQGKKPTSKAPAAGAPSGVAHAVSHAKDPTPETRSSEHLQCAPNSTQAITAQSGNLIAAIHEHELGGKIAKTTAERTRARKKTESNDQEKGPAGKAPTAEAPLDIKDTAPEAKNTAPEKILERFHPDPQSSEAAQARKKADLLAKIRELELKLEIEKQKEERTKAAENAKRIFQEKRPTEKVPQSETSLEVQRPVWRTNQIALNRNNLKQPQPPAVNTQALDAHEGKIGDIKARIHQYELDRRAGKGVTEGVTYAATKVEQTQPEGSKTKGAKSETVKTGESKPEGTKLGRTESMGMKPKEAKPKGVGTDIKPEAARMVGGKSAQTRPEGAKPEGDNPEGTKSVENIVKDPTETPPAIAPDYRTPLQIHRPASHTHEMAPKKKKPEHFPPNISTAQALAACESKIRSFKTRLEEHESKKKLRKQRAEQKAKELAGKINDNDINIPPENASTVETQLEADKAVSHVDDTGSKKRKLEEAPEAILDSAKKRRCTPEPTVRKDSPGGRKHSETMEPCDQSSSSISGVEHSERAAEDTKPTPSKNNPTAQSPLESDRATPSAVERVPKKRKAEGDPEAILDSAKKQRSTPRPKVHKDSSGKRKQSETPESCVQSSDSISAIQYSGRAAEDTDPTSNETSSTAQPPLETGKAVQRADETAPKKRKAEEYPDAIPDSVKKLRYSPKQKALEETPQGRESIGPEGPGTESAEYISLAEFGEQDEEDKEQGDAEQEDAEQKDAEQEDAEQEDAEQEDAEQEGAEQEDAKQGNRELENVIDESVSEAPQRPVEESRFPGTLALSGIIKYLPPPPEPMYDPFVDEVDYEID